MILAFQVGGPLLGNEVSVNVRVADHHFEPFLKWSIGDDLAVFHVRAIRERNPVGQGPGVALTRNSAQLVGDSQTLFVRGDYCDE